MCAHGPHASEVTNEHSLAFSEGRYGPFDKLHQMDSWILLLGVGFNRCTALHYAESLVENRRVAKVRFKTEEKGQRKWIEVPNVADDNETHLPIIGDKFVAAGKAKRGLIGKAPSTLFRMQELVSFAQTYFYEIL